MWGKNNNFLSSKSNLQNVNFFMQNKANPKPFFVKGLMDKDYIISNIIRNWPVSLYVLCVQPSSLGSSICVQPASQLTVSITLNKDAVLTINA